MSLQLHIERPPLPSLVAALLLSLLPACGGDGLTLPDDGQAVELIAVSGDEQSGTVGRRLTEPLVVEARGRAGQPVRDASVTFSFKGDFNGGALDPATVTTGPDGQAAAQVTLGQASGLQAVEARTAPGRSGDLVVDFRLMAVQPDDDDDDEGRGGGDREPRRGGGDDDDDDEDDRGNRGRGGGGGDDKGHGGRGGHGGHGGGDDDDD